MSAGIGKYGHLSFRHCTLDQVQAKRFLVSFVASPTFKYSFLFVKTSNQIVLSTFSTNPEQRGHAASQVP